MKIAGVGPIVGNGPMARLVVTVENDNKERFHIRFFADWAKKLTPDQLLAAVRGVLAHRDSPVKEFRSLGGTEI